ncbi:ATP-dependent DNA ligase protein [Rhizobium phage RHph_X3_9]|nr:ATP-dependent DNA ligase protein [Rhizobium phage RHph_X3_9]
MAGEAIELAQPKYRPDIMTYPAAVSLKLDGVPGRFIGNRLPQTRQNTDIVSVAHIQNWIVQHIPAGVGIVGELYDPTLKFKVISGQVRDTKEQHPNLKLYAFDLYVPDNPAAVFQHRIEALRLVLEDIAGKLGCQPDDLPVIRIPQIIVHNEEEARDAHDALMAANPDAEGTMLASLTRTFEPGKRQWTLQKNKPEPTMDIEIIGMNEAVSEDGKPLGRAGRLVGLLNRIKADGTQEYAQIGIGPGRLTHREAKQIWLDYKAGTWRRCIAEVKYMKDDSYEALRQPTFQRWRADKSEADVLDAA